MAKKNVAVLTMSQEQVNSLTLTKIKEDVLPRTTGRRMHQFLVELLKAGKVVINKPAALFALTYGNVTVEGFVPEKGQDFGKKNAEKVLSQSEFDNLSAEDASVMVAGYTTEHRAELAATAAATAATAAAAYAYAAAAVTELVVDGGLRLSPRDVAYLTNGGIVVEGIEIVKVTNRPVHTIITKGIVVK